MALQYRKREIFFDKNGDDKILHKYQIHTITKVLPKNETKKYSPYRVKGYFCQSWCADIGLSNPFRDNIHGKNILPRFIRCQVIASNFRIQNRFLRESEVYWQFC